MGIFGRPRDGAAELQSQFRHAACLEHFPEKWIPVFRKEMRQNQNKESWSVSRFNAIGKRSSAVDGTPRPRAIRRDGKRVNMIVKDTGLTLVVRVLIQRASVRVLTVRARAFNPTATGSTPDRRANVLANVLRKTAMT